MLLVSACLVSEVLEKLVKHRSLWTVVYTFSMRGKVLGLQESHIFLSLVICQRKTWSIVFPSVAVFNALAVCKKIGDEKWTVYKVWWGKRSWLQHGNITFHNPKAGLHPKILLGLWWDYELLLNN